MINEIINKGCLTPYFYWKIALATDRCSEGYFVERGVLTSPYLYAITAFSRKCLFGLILINEIHFTSVRYFNQIFTFFG